MPRPGLVLVEQRPAPIRVMTEKDDDQVLLKTKGAVRAGKGYEVPLNFGPRPWSRSIVSKSKPNGANGKSRTKS